VQRIAVCCSASQCVAVCCSVFQYAEVCCGVLQRVAVWCICVAVRCSVLQCVAVKKEKDKRARTKRGRDHKVCCIVLQSNAVSCNVANGVSQYAAVCCSVLQCVAARESVSQYAVVCCSMLRCVALI